MFPDLSMLLLGAFWSIWPKDNGRKETNLSYKMSILFWHLMLLHHHSSKSLAYKCGIKWLSVGVLNDIHFKEILTLKGISIGLGKTARHIWEMVFFLWFGLSWSRYGLPMRLLMESLSLLQEFLSTISYLSCFLRKCMQFPSIFQVILPYLSYPFFSFYHLCIFWAVWCFHVFHIMTLINSLILYSAFFSLFCQWFFWSSLWLFENVVFPQVRERKKAGFRVHKKMQIRQIFCPLKYTRNANFLRYRSISKMPNICKK